MATTMKREKYIIYSFDKEADGGQVMVDVVMARGISEAEQKVQKRRPYAIVDGGGLLLEHVKGLLETLNKTPAEIDADWKEIG